MKFVKSISWIAVGGIFSIVLLAANRFAMMYRLSPKVGIEKLLHVYRYGWDSIAEKPFYISFNPQDWIFPLCVVVFLIMILSSYVMLGKKYRPGVEHGSARWGTAADINPYIDPKFYNNILLTKTERLTMNPRMKNPKNNKNKNVLVIGGSGSGKTRFFVKPNLMQMHSSYVVTDPKGTILNECGKMLFDHKYFIKCLNIKSAEAMKTSMHYNPFVYIRSEADILLLVDTLISNTSGEGEKAKEDFWVKAERLYYMALIAYIWYEAPEEEKNFITLLELINASEAREDDEGYKSPVDILFDELKEREPNHFAIRQYQKYKQAAGKTAKSILISCGARLAPFDIQEVLNLMQDDELELDALGDRKSALFVITSDSNKTFNFLAAMMYTQLFTLLINRADDKYGGRLPVHVRCILDEFANIGRIPDFETLIATIRSREISACPILQNQSQLNALYKEDNANTIISNCDTKLYLGGDDAKTLESWSKKLGKETIDLFNEGRSRGNQSSDSTNYQKLGRELMTMDELATMDGGKCICMIRGVRPFLSPKYDIEKHPQYRNLSDYSKANAFDITKMHKKRSPISQGEIIDYFQII